MCEQTEDCHAWLGPLVTKVSPNLGKDVENVRCVTVASNLFINSNLFFVNIVSNTSPVDDDEGKKRAQSTNIVVKKMPPETLQDVMKSKQQFHNEVLFYQKFAQYYDRAPRCIYATEEPSPLDSVIVLEDVATKRGYSVCKWKYDTPLEYTLAAIREIARFHAIAYATKRTREKEFFDFVNAIEVVRFYPESMYSHIFKETATRFLDFLRRQSHDKEFWWSKSPFPLCVTATSRSITCCSRRRVTSRKSSSSTLRTYATDRRFWICLRSCVCTVPETWTKLCWTMF